ncbi:hypothetical protein IFM89_000996 [Coptis chinensis]|uniref:Uncharacterized protein n=1 Tax=Coptis chinensis TaxID=261450 RepID=A0A835IIE0_9MAGN|nr:hypothetical protein IFM89_000996 [Coptis chinensis]
MSAGSDVAGLDSGWDQSLVTQLPWVIIWLIVFFLDTRKDRQVSHTAQGTYIVLRVSSLSNNCYCSLHRYEIQLGMHDPYEDCVAAMRLYKRMRAQNHPVEEFTTSTVAHSTCCSTIYDSLKPKELEGMCSEDLLKISKPKYRCWCLDSKPNLES